MKKIAVFTLIVLFSFTACKKDESIYDSSKTVPGMVQFTLKNGVTLKQSLNAIKGLGVEKYDLHNFYYTKVIPNDSMTYYWHVFKSCTYIKAFDIFQNPETPSRNSGIFIFLTSTISLIQNGIVLCKKKN